jgi:hypothetical protein
MALMSPQPVSTILTPTFAAVNSSDTIDTRSGPQWLHVKVGGTATTITVTPGGNQDYSGAAKTALSSGAVTNADRIFYIPPSIGAPDTGLVTVAYSNTTAVTAGLFRI